MSVLIVRLRGEGPHEVEAVGGDNTGALARALAALDRESYRYIPYVDPFGLTIFNRLQMAVVIPELERLRDEPALHGLRGAMDRIIGMAERCQREVHLYLEFEGD